MKSIEISLGHAAMHSPWLVHAPNPSASICATMVTTRVARSGWPWGNTPRCDTFAATNSMADALGQAATQAPHPMRAAGPRRDEPARLNDAVERAAVHHQVFDDRERPRAPRLDPDLRAVPERPQVKLARGGGALRPVRPAVDDHPARPADPLTAVVVERNRFFLAGDELLVQHVEQLQERHVWTDVR